MTGRQSLHCFSAVEFEHEFIVRKVKLREDDEHPSNDHESQRQAIDTFPLNIGAKIVIVEKIREAYLFFKIDRNNVVL